MARQRKDREIGILGSYIRAKGGNEVDHGWPYPVHYFLFPLLVPLLFQEAEGEWPGTKSESCDHYQ